MWTSFPAWLRLCIAFALFGIGGFMLWFTMSPHYHGSYRRTGWRFGFMIIGLGFIALIFSSKTNSEKKGYRF